MWLKCLDYLHGSRESPRGSEAAWSKPSGKPWQHLWPRRNPILRSNWGKVQSMSEQWFLHLACTCTRGRHVLARQRGILINNELQIEFCWLRNLRAFSPLQHTSPGIIILCPQKLIIKSFDDCYTPMQCSKSPAVLDDTYLALFGE